MIHRDDIDDVMKNLAFDFFYRFSRFEFALKENGKVKAGRRGVAEPDWTAFIEEHETTYQLSERGKELLRGPRKFRRRKRVIAGNGHRLLLTLGQASYRA
ncbi:hypothetical protein [Pandoraea sp. 64-18]|uniref:hypothetical protein n=1 Tax=Pandoraea sp. 64-18 TaxID=1895806 RepID=UPI00257E8E8C|nr:hypothetical protein [Pandoraea sp. 64-18]